MSDFEYIIVGDTEKYKDCLVCVCGSDKEDAERALNRMLNNPTDNDKRLMERHSNLKVKKVHKDSCWWRYGCD